MDLHPLLDHETVHYKLVFDYRSSLEICCPSLAALVWALFELPITVGSAEVVHH